MLLFLFIQLSGTDVYNIVVGIFSWQVCSLCGHYESVGGMKTFFLVIPKRGRVWHINYEGQGLKAIVKRVDQTKGTASGIIQCARPRHLAGEFDFRPNDNVPNRFDISLRLGITKHELTVRCCE